MNKTNKGSNGNKVKSYALEVGLEVSLTNLEIKRRVKKEKNFTLSLPPCDSLVI